MLQLYFCRWRQNNFTNSSQGDVNREKLFSSKRRLAALFTFYLKDNQLSSHEISAILTALGSIAKTRAPKIFWGGGPDPGWEWLG